jgi:hypothetical protein
MLRQRGAARSIAGASVSAWRCVFFRSFLAAGFDAAGATARGAS